MGSGSVQEELSKAAEYLDKLENDWYRRQQEADDLKANESEKRRKDTEQLKAKLPLATFAMPGRGLQGWTERVIELGCGDPELVKLCRDYVRTTILKKRNAGALQSVNWDEEPLPPLE